MPICCARRCKGSARRNCAPTGDGNRIAGITVAEAVGRDWPEYEIRNLRRQLELDSTTLGDVDRGVDREVSLHADAALRE
jgi:hypothetical protein